MFRHKGVDFRTSVLGQSFSRVPSVFDLARQEFAGDIDRWGYLETRKEYAEALAEADVVVSTARHEFFGISILEAVAAGAYPLVPRRLSYPEIFELDSAAAREISFYEGGATALALRLETLARSADTADL